MADATWSDRVLDAAEDRSHLGPLAGATHHGLAQNPTCGDRLEVDLVVDPVSGAIKHARFMHRGCTFSRAAAAIWCDKVEGRIWDEVAELSVAAALRLLGLEAVAAGPKMRCALLPLTATQLAIATSSP